MKKIFLLLLLAGCVTNGTIFAPSKTIDNPKCENLAKHEVKVFQVLDDYILGTVCREMKSYGCSDDLTVYLKKEKDKIYYNDQVIDAPKGKCISYSSTFTYTTVKERTLTIPIVKFIDKDISNPEYEKFMKDKEEQSKKEKKDTKKK